MGDELHHLIVMTNPLSVVSFTEMGGPDVLSGNPSGVDVKHEAIICTSGAELSNLAADRQSAVTLLW